MATTGQWLYSIAQVTPVTKSGQDCEQPIDASVRSSDDALAVLCDPRFHEHSPPGFHPERPRRLDAAEAGGASSPESAVVSVAIVTAPPSRARSITSTAKPYSA